MSRIAGSDRIMPGSIRIIRQGMTDWNPDRIGLTPLGVIRNPIRRSAPDHAFNCGVNRGEQPPTARHWVPPGNRANAGPVERSMSLP